MPIGYSKTPIQKKYLHSCSFDKSYTDRHNSLYRALKLKILPPGCQKFNIPPKNLPPQLFLWHKISSQNLKKLPKQGILLCGSPGILKLCKFCKKPMLILFFIGLTTRPLKEESLKTEKQKFWNTFWRVVVI